MRGRENERKRGKERPAEEVYMQTHRGKTQGQLEKITQVWS